MNCSAGTDLVVLARDGRVSRCRACASGDHALHGPCPVAESCAATYPQDHAVTSRKIKLPVDSCRLRAWVHAGVSIEAFDPWFKQAKGQKLSVTFYSEEGDSVASETLPDLVEKVCFAFADVEVRTTLAAKEVRYMGLLKRCLPTVSFTVELRAYEVGFDWYHFIGRATMTARRGFRTRAVVPLHPAQAALVPLLREKVEHRGIRVETEVHPKFPCSSAMRNLAKGTARRSVPGQFEVL